MEVIIVLKSNSMDYTKALYVTDMVKGFVIEGALHDNRIESTIPEQIKLLERFKKERQFIGLIRDSHNKGCAEFNTFPEHCLEGTSESENVGEIMPYEECSTVYLKNSTSAIFAPNLLSDIINMPNLKEVVGVGCCTDICIVNFLIPLVNFFNQNNKNVKVFVVKKATETYNIPEVHEADYYNKVAYQLMAQAGIIVVEDFEELEEKEKELGLSLKM
jgi:nicotinamidase-related amidase